MELASILVTHPPRPSVDDILPHKVRNLIDMQHLHETVAAKDFSITSVPDTLVELMKVFAGARLNKSDKRTMVSNIMVFLIRGSSMLISGQDALIELVPTLIDTFCFLAKHRSQFRRGCQQYCC
jgi:hypothetical protein